MVEKSEARGCSEGRAGTGCREKVPCHFRQFKGLPSRREQRILGVPYRVGALSTSAPGLSPPSLRRSEVNRRGGLKTTPTTLLQRPSLPRLLNIVSLRTLLHRLPNRPPSPLLAPSLSLSLS